MLIYDLEVLKEPKTPEDWKAYDKLGIACIGAWACEYGDLNGILPKNMKSAYCIYPQAKLTDFVRTRYFHQDVVVGFNSQRFDDNVCKANGIYIETTYDLLRECWRAAGLDPDYDFPKGGDPKVQNKYAGFRLQDLAIANLPRDRCKTMTGRLAPIEWSKGNYHKVLSYCLQDVSITKELLELGLKGQLWHGATRQFLKLNPLDSNGTNLKEILNIR